MSVCVINAYALGNSDPFWIPAPTSLPTTLSNFYVVPTSGVDWGDGTAGDADTNTTKTFNASSTGIVFNNPAAVYLIDCGSYTPTPLRGTIDLSKLTYLSAFTCNGQQITHLTGYLSCPNLSNLTFIDNKVTGTLPSLASLSFLNTFRCQLNLLTGSLPSFSSNTNLTFLNCSFNQFSGSLPALPAAIKYAYLQSNLLTGTIPSLSGYAALEGYYVSSNQLTGSIPNLSSNSVLRDFHCQDNSLVSFAGGSVSNTLASFQAQNNLLSSASVDAILAAFVAANRTTGTRRLYLDGTGNAAPTSSGLISRQTLISRGWDVRTN